MKSKLYAIGVVVALTVFAAVAVAGSSGWSSGLFKTFMKGAGFGTKLQTGMVNVEVQGTREMFTGYNSSSSKTFSVDKDGDLTALTVASTGAVSVGGALTLDDASSDVCATLGAKALFYNSTGNILCYCNHDLVDLKIDGSSASCF